MKDLYVCSTYYHVLITEVKRMNHYIDDADIMITDHISEGKVLADTLKNRGDYGQVYYVDSDLKNWPYHRWGFLTYKKNLPKMVENAIDLDLSKYREIFIFMDDTWFAHYLKSKHIYYNIIEDGIDVFKIMDKTAFYYMVEKPKFSITYIINRAIGRWVDYYLDCEYVKTIEVNEKKDLLIDSEDKRVIELNREMMFDNLTPEDKDSLVSLFTGNDFLISDSKISVIFTSSVVTDQQISEKDFVKAIVSVLNKHPNEKFYIKPHPRDEINYSDLNVNVINKNFPSEIFRFMNMDNINSIISLGSISVEKFFKKKVIYYSVDDMKRIAKK